MTTADAWNIAALAGWLLSAAVCVAVGVLVGWDMRRRADKRDERKR